LTTQTSTSGIFADLNFKVGLFQYNTVAEIQRSISNIAEASQSSSPTMGGMNGATVQARDKDYNIQDDVIENLDDCPNLTGVPKIILVQACRSD
jgi:hypothetical protein